MTTVSTERSFGTASAAAALFVAFVTPTPTISTAFSSQSTPTPRAFSSFANASDRRERQLGSSVSDVFDSSTQDFSSGASATRVTSDAEIVIGALRDWRGLSENWDGDGAAAPVNTSIDDAVSFLRLSGDGAKAPEPSMNANGHAGLIWDDATSYAEIEFLGSARLAYYIKSKDDIHKGVISFNQEQIPDILASLLAFEQGKKHA